MDSAEIPHWERQRSELVSQISENPSEAMGLAVRVVNMSLHPDIRGEENEEHGEVLQRVKSAMGDDWGEVLKRSKKKAAQNALVLLDARETGGVFGGSPEVIFVTRDQTDNGSISVDLGESDFVP